MKAKEVNKFKALGMLGDVENAFLNAAKLDPKFINSVISIETKFSAEELIQYIFKVEKEFHRKRDLINAPRTCDIDIIDFNGQIINISNKNISLKIPHPRLEQRSFVLFPIREIDKNWKSPLSGKKIDQLIENLDIESKKNITII